MMAVFFLFAGEIAGAGNSASADRTVVVVLFDGFSPFMMDGVSTPHFDRLAREGASSRHLVPVFPALSMVNHTSFQTGCQPGKHGIVANEFRDPAKGWYNPKTDRADAAWRTGCEAMWQAAERQGVKAAAFNIVGRWSSKNGAAASTINAEVPWSAHEDDETILTKAVAALNRTDTERPRLIALYFDYPDSVAHGDGVHGDRTKLAVARADAVIGRLVDAITAQPAGAKVTLVVGADHGMTKVEKVINIDRLESLHHFTAQAAYGSGTAMLYLKPGENPQRVAQALAKYRDVFTVYRKGHFPAFVHIGDGPRVGDLLLITHPPYAFEGHELMKPEIAARAENTSGPAIYAPEVKWFNAMHGFMPERVDMQAIFYAWGDGVAAGKILPRIEMIDVAPTVLDLLGLKPGRDTDGKVVDLGR
ncbi:MAG: ectonucleotide pyrophosphatase/phosphodiesterase [Rhizomicrobium sp.]